MAAGSWEPVVAGEYLMREWILSLGSLSTVCTLTGAGFSAVLQLEEDVEAGLKELCQSVKGKYAWRITAAQLSILALLTTLHTWRNKANEFMNYLQQACQSFDWFLSCLVPESTFQVNVPWQLHKDTGNKYES